MLSITEGLIVGLLFFFMRLFLFFVVKTENNLVYAMVYFTIGFLAGGLS